MDTDKNGWTLNPEIGTNWKDNHTYRNHSRGACLQIRVYPCASVVELNRLGAGNERKF
jgi:hypothetical protein